MWMPEINILGANLLTRVTEEWTLLLNANFKIIILEKQWNYLQFLGKVDIIFTRPVFTAQSVIRENVMLVGLK